MCTYVRTVHISLDTVNMYILYIYLCKLLFKYVRTETHTVHLPGHTTNIYLKLIYLCKLYCKVHSVHLLIYTSSRSAWTLYLCTYIQNMSWTPCKFVYIINNTLQICSVHTVQYIHST
jgi:hypothetical protein